MDARVEIGPQFVKIQSGNWTPPSKNAPRGAAVTNWEDLGDWSARSGDDDVLATKDPIDHLAAVVAQVANAHVCHARKSITRDTGRHRHELRSFFGMDWECVADTLGYHL